MATLYELTGQMQALLALMEDPDVDPQIIEDALEAISGEIEVKADGYARVMAELEARKAAVKAEKDRLAALESSLGKNIDRMKESLKTSMIATGKTKFKTDLFSFSVQKNPPKVVIDDPSRIPEGFLIPQPPKVDTASIKESLKSVDAGSMWEGICHLEQGESLRIR
jgi:hypothetical protein